MKTLRILVLALLAATTAGGRTPGSAQAFSLGLEAGAVFFDNGLLLLGPEPADGSERTVSQGLVNADPARGFGARAILHFTPELAIEAAYSRSDLHNDAFDLVSHTYASMVEIRLPLSADVGLRLAAGGGGITFDPDDDEFSDITDPIASVAIGLGVGATDRISFWLDSRGHAQFCRGEREQDRFTCENGSTLWHLGVWAGATYTF